MKPIKIFLNIKHDNKKDEKDSIWETLKSPAETISKIILIVIAITPIVSVSLILSYLDSFHATVIGFSLFSNIANLGLIIIYSFSFFASYLLVIFALPAFYGYLYGQYLPYYDINNLWKSIWKKFKVNKEEKIGQRSKVLILIFSVLILFFIGYLLCIHWLQLRIFKLIVIYLVINLLLICIIPPIKEDKKFKWYGIFWLFFAYISSLLFLVFISISHKHIFSLSILNIIYAIMLFITGVLYANGKKINAKKQDDRYKIKYIIFMIILIFFVANLRFKIPFSKIAMSFSGLGNKKVAFKLKTDIPDYLKKLLTNNSQSHQTKKLFLLIQTSKNYYVEKLPVKKRDIIKLPKKYITNIITQ